MEDVEFVNRDRFKWPSGSGQRPIGHFMPQPDDCTGIGTVVVAVQCAVADMDADLKPAIDIIGVA